ncbi:glycerol-3-phosphate acyltransferase 1, mitochondrial isoform X1 [Helicoverpa zea]|uniref:glycerol-3-phosphate acyltransferase 1, mitochondrial isoform X1 n=2 Tax=Helicoverpa zea TaxID=7113 RepID=UPI001F5A5AA0|nr:glycerol-3-phosphate acyltransferase 1, mitochondrial isoform X1 [Helicoverpa zea]
MDTMISVWTMVEHVRVASGAAELAIFTAILYWFFTSSRVADMLEVVGERVGGWCGRDTSSSLRQAVRARKRQQEYAKVDNDVACRTSSLYRIKEGPVIPAPEPQMRPPAGLACGRCAPVSRDSWQDPKVKDTGAVINILDIGRQNFANGGVVSRYLCDLAQCCNLFNYDYKDVVPNVLKDDSVESAIEEATQEELSKAKEAGQSGAQYATVRKRVEAKALKVVQDISSAMSNNVLKFVAWVCHKAVRRVAGGGCGTRVAGVERLRRANAAGLPLVFVPLHRSHFDYILMTFTLYLTGLRPPLVAAGDNMRIPFFGWFLRGCGAFYIRRRVEGSEYHGDPTYKSALRAYILNSLSAGNNLEFFIEGGRTRTGKPQTPKAGILSVIMDAYLDGTIDDALLVPATLNYDKLVDGNFVREQLGMPKQMETFWSALRGIWRTLNTNHGSIRVDFNQPISLKELVTSFQKYQHYKAPIESSLTPPNNNLAVNLDRQILYNHSHSSLYGADVSTDHKMMVEAIGRHLVYDASQATALMCTNVLSYVLLTEARRGATLGALTARLAARGAALAADGRDRGYTGEPSHAVRHALDMLGRGLVRVSGSGPRASVRAQASVSASLELAYYANAVVAHYAAPAIVATALETLVCSSSSNVVRQSDLLNASLQLCEVLSHEFIVCAPCQRIQDRMLDAIDGLEAQQLLVKEKSPVLLEEEQWSRRMAARLEEDDVVERPDPAQRLTYTVSQLPEALAERRRLLLTLRPLLEAYAATCRNLEAGTMKDVVKNTLDSLTDDFTHNRMVYGEAVSTDAIRNCLRLLRQWGAVEVAGRERRLRLRAPYDAPAARASLTHNVTQFCVPSPLLEQL